MIRIVRMFKMFRIVWTVEDQCPCFKIAVYLNNPKRPNNLNYPNAPIISVKLILRNDLKVLRC